MLNEESNHPKSLFNCKRLRFRLEVKCAAWTKYIGSFNVEHRELDHLNISLPEWQLLDNTYQFFVPFKEATKACEGNSVMIDEVLVDINIIVTWFEILKAKHANIQDLPSAMTTAWYAFYKYYNFVDKMLLYATVLLLHSAYRKVYVNSYWRTG